MELTNERLIIGQEPVRLLFSSQPYPIITKMGFTVAADALVKKGRAQVPCSIIIAPASLASGLYQRMKENRDSLVGVDVWIYKAGVEKSAPYVVED
jgi:hypothetical protein